MKFVTPLDRQALVGIPSSLEGKFNLGGPYKLDEMLREPDEYGDNYIDWRQLQIAQANGVHIRPAYVEVSSKQSGVQASNGPSFPANIYYTLRYLYRDQPSSSILGVVELKVTHEIRGVLNQFEFVCKTVIQNVYVKPDSRGRGIARILLAEVLSDAPDVRVHPHFSEDGARLFGFDRLGNRELRVKHQALQV